jgi:hypothetical protein
MRLLREADLVTVTALLGHKSITTTAIYTRPTAEDEAAARLTCGESTRHRRPYRQRPIAPPPGPAGYPGATLVVY